MKISPKIAEVFVAGRQNFLSRYAFFTLRLYLLFDFVGGGVVVVVVVVRRGGGRGDDGGSGGGEGGDDGGEKVFMLDC